MNDRETFLAAVEINDPAMRISDRDVIHAAAADSHPRRRWPAIAAAMLVLAVGLGITEATGVAQLTSTVMRLTTGSGTLVIETDDPSVKITIDDEEISIRGAGVEELVLKPGQYQVAAVQDGKPVSQQWVTITRGGKEVVRVTLEGISRNSTGWHGWPADAPPAAIAPFSAEQARQYQEAWAQYLGVPVEYTNRVGMTFRLIPPGEFMMGSPEDDRDARPDEKPQHRVRLTQSFYLQTTEVTQKQYTSLIGAMPWKGKRGTSDDELAPAAYIDWHDATAFATKLSEKESTTRYYLPSEAEWEFAARAGGEGRYGAGNDLSDVMPFAWTRHETRRSPRPVGMKRPDSFGLFDMIGNTWEWCSDGYDAGFYERSPLENPQATGSVYRVFRGGGFESRDESYRVSRREPTTADERADAGGFRLALTVDSVKAALSGSPVSLVAPFSAEQARQSQEAWARHLGVPVEYTNNLGMTFRLIPPGEFMMGSSPEEIDKFVLLARESLTGRWKDFEWRSFIQSEGPQHRVRITKPFYLGLHEVTESQYQQIMGIIPSTAPHLKDVDTQAAFPVDSVSWNDCAEFCVRLNLKETPNDTAYRLPTEAEWEYACRAGTATSWLNGEDDLALRDYEVVRANNNGGAHPVGGKKPNQFGLFDMGGNMMEWCADWYTESDYPVSDPMQPEHDPTGPESGQRKIYRGGSFQGLSPRARSASRNAWLPTERNDGIGFRVALTVESVKSALSPVGVGGGLRGVNFEGDERFSAK